MTSILNQSKQQATYSHLPCVATITDVEATPIVYRDINGDWQEKFFKPVQVFTADGVLKDFRSGYGVAADATIISFVDSRDGNPVERIKQYDRHGYMTIAMADNDSKLHTVFVHRVVAYSWLERPSSEEGRTDINHIDGNPLNNHLANLCFMSRRENMAYSKQYLKPMRLEIQQRKSNVFASASTYSAFTEVAELAELAELVA